MFTQRSLKQKSNALFFVREQNMRIKTISFLCCIMASSSGYAEPRFDAMFQDNAVLQRDKSIIIWGTADKNETIKLHWLGTPLTLRADEKGDWQTTLPPQPAGLKGQLTLSGDGGKGQTLNNIVTGDVFLCSGQSNMEMPIKQTQNGHEELKNADFQNIRLFQVPHDYASVPQKDFKAMPKWETASSETVAGFSAACFFMAQDLHKSQKLPIGLIHASWGGTGIDTWRSAASLSADPLTAPDMLLLAQHANDAASANRSWGKRWGEWWQSVGQGSPWTAPLQDAKPIPRLTNWEKWGIEALENYDGQMWLQAEIFLTAAEAKMAKTFELGMIDDLDQSWVNGIGIGTVFGHWNNRLYPVGKNVLKPGTNRLTIHVTDQWARAGGMVSDPATIGLRLVDGRLLQFKNWVYRTEPNTKTPPHAPWTAHWGKSTAGNAMIAPVMPYTLRGVAWYQGESDTDTGPAYRTRLAGLMKDWRTGFKNADLPFLIVQLSDFGAARSTPADSGWAALREEQRQAVLADRHAALVITRDLGDRLDVHPTNKKTVGLRLARAARAIIYGEGVAPSGPNVEHARVDGRNIRVSVTGASNGLRSYSSASAVGFELCSDTPQQCVYVNAQVEGDTIILPIPNGINPSRVRYCWADSSICNVFDGKDDPLGPFEVKIMPRV